MVLEINGYDMLRPVHGPTVAPISEDGKGTPESEEKRMRETSERKSTFLVNFVFNFLNVCSLL
jgi:hypothetical protein